MASAFDSREETNGLDTMIANPFADRGLGDPDSASSCELQSAADRIQLACEQALSDTSIHQQYRPRVGFFTLTNFCIVTILLTFCEFIFILYGASVGQLIGLGIGELTLYTLVAIGAMIDLHHYRKRASHSGIADRLEFLANEVLVLEQLRSKTQLEADALRQTRGQLEHEEKLVRYSMGKLELTVAELHESVDELEAIESEKMNTIADQKIELENIQAETILARERVDQLQLEVERLELAKAQSIRLKETADAELVRIQTELDLNRNQQDQIAIRLGGLNEKVEAASQKLELQESAFAEKLDELAKTSATIEEKRQLQREVDSQLKLLESLQEAEASLTAKLEDAESMRRLEEMELRKEQLQKEILSLEASLQEINATRKLLAAQTANLDKEREESRSDLKELHRCIEAARSDLGDLLRTQEELTLFVGTLRNEIEQREHEKQCQFASLGEANQRLLDIQLDVEKATLALETAERRKEQVTARIDSLNELVELRSQDVLKAKQELIELRSSIKKDTETLSTLEAAKTETEQLNEQLALKIGELQTTQQQCNDQTRALSELNAEIASVENSLTLRKEALQDIQRILHEQIKVLEETRKQSVITTDIYHFEAESYANEIRNLHEDLAGLVLNYELTKKELHDNQQLLSKERTEAERERIRLVDQHDEAKCELEATCESIATQQQEIQSLASNRLLAQTELDRIEAELDQAQQQLTLVSDQQRQRRAENEQWKAENERLIELITSQQREHNRYALEISKLQDQHRQASRDWELIEADLAKSEHELAFRREELASLEREAKRTTVLAQEARDLEQKVTDQKRMSAQLVLEEREIALRLERLRNQRDERKAEVDRLEERLSELHSSVSNHSSTLREEQLAIEELFNRQKAEQQKLLSITNELADFQLRIAKSESNAASWENRSREAEIRLRHFEAEIAEAQQVGQQWDAYVATLRREGELIANRKQENEQALNHTLMVKQKAMDELKRTEAAVSRTQNELYQLESQLAEARDSADSLSREVTELTNQRSRCAKELDAKERRLVEVARDVDQLELKLGSQKDALARESRKLQEREAARDSVNAELSNLVSRRDVTQRDLEQVLTKTLKAQEALEDLHCQIEIAREEANQAKASREELKRLRVEQADAERTASALRFKIEEANAVHERLLAEVGQQTARVNSLEIRASEISLQIEEKMIAVTEREANQKQLQEQCATAEKQLSLIQAQIAKANSALSNTEIELNASSLRLDETREQCIELEEQRQQSIRAQETAAKNLKQTQDSLQSVSQQLTEAQANLESHQQRTLAQNRELADRESQLVGLRTSIVAIESQKASLQHELEEYERLRIVSLDKLQQIQAKLVFGIEHEQQLERQFNDIAEQHRQLEEELREGRNSRDLLQRELEMESRVIAKLRSDRDALLRSTSENQTNTQVNHIASPVREAINEAAPETSKNAENQATIARGSSTVDALLAPASEGITSPVPTPVLQSAMPSSKTLKATKELDMWEQMLAELVGTTQELGKARSMTSQPSNPS